MADSGGEDRTLEATPRKLQEARERGEVAISREGASLGILFAAILGIQLAGGLIVEKIGRILLPFLDQPEALLNMSQQGWRATFTATGSAIILAIAPFFGLLLAGAFLPYLLQGSITVAAQRMAPQLSRISPMGGAKRILNLKGLFEFGKSIVKMAAIGTACFIYARPLYEQSIGLVSASVSILPHMMQETILQLIFPATLVALLIACVDVPYQHWTFRRSMRMSTQEMRDELRSTDGDPHVKGRIRRLARQRAQRRMMHDVPKATVVIVNPTHYAVALRYRRGEDAAPVVVAKGVDLIALRIRQTADQHRVPVMSNPPLARALHAAAEIGEVIPHEHFEAVAKIIGMIWAQRRTPGLTGQVPAMLHAPTHDHPAMTAYDERVTP